MRNPAYRLAAVLLAVLLMLTAGTAALGKPIDTSLPKEQTVNWLVIDVSKWNDADQINWERLKDDGVEAAIIRIGGRGYADNKPLYLDEMFATHFHAAKAAGLHVGVYFFSYAMTEAMGVEEAELTIKTMRENNCEPDMPVFIDVEDYGYDHQHLNAGKATNTAVVNAFCETIRNAGYYPGIYTGKWFSEVCFNQEAFENKAVWIAQYTDVCTYAGVYDMWQFTDKSYVSPAAGDLRKLTAVTGNVDVSICRVDFPALINAAEEPTFEGHTLEANWRVTRPATCAKDGLRERRCADCGVTLLTEYVPRGAHRPGRECVLLGDTTSNTAGKTVAERGRLHPETEKDYEILYRNTFELMGGTRLTYCTACGLVLEAAYSFPDCPHEHTEKTQTERTCTAGGVISTVCKDCGKTLHTVLTDAGPHTQGDAVFGSENCAEGGMKTKRCKVCGAFVCGEYAPAAEHSFVRTELTVLPSLEKAGEGTFVCAVCKKTETRVVPALSPGDLDMNGKTEAADARLALRFSVSLEPDPDPEESEVGDVDQDGKISAADARLILRFAVNLEDAKAVYAAYTAQREAEQAEAERAAAEEAERAEAERAAAEEAEPASPAAEAGERESPSAEQTADAQAPGEPSAADDAPEAKAPDAEDPAQEDSSDPTEPEAPAGEQSADDAEEPAENPDNAEKSEDADVLF